jgi:ketosteroid isomerase-like protein
MANLKRNILAIAFVVAHISTDAQMRSHDAEQAAWIQAVTSSMVYTEKLYTTKAVVVDADKNGLRAIDVNGLSDFYRNRGWKKVESLQSIGATDANVHIGYEIVTFKAGDESYTQLIIWNQKNGGPLRELEVIGQSVNQRNTTPGMLDAARAEWVRLCNEHDPRKLVGELYTADAMYYNHKPMIVGTEAIAKEYWYMGNSSYQLRLAPIMIEMVSQDLAFEIGQCSGSYNGKYVLVWKKSADKGWQVALDSNI